MRRACDIGLREIRDLRTPYLNGVKYSDFTNFFYPTDKYRHLRTMLEQKVRQRVHVRRTTEKSSRECARNARILIRKQAEKFSVI